MIPLLQPYADRMTLTAWLWVEANAHKFTLVRLGTRTRDLVMYCVLPVGADPMTECSTPCGSMAAKILHDTWCVVGARGCLLEITINLSE